MSLASILHAGKGSRLDPRKALRRSHSRNSDGPKTPSRVPSTKNGHTLKSERGWCSEMYRPASRVPSLTARVTALSIQRLTVRRASLRSLILS